VSVVTLFIYLTHCNDLTSQSVIMNFYSHSYGWSFALVQFIDPRIWKWRTITYITRNCEQECDGFV